MPLIKSSFDNGGPVPAYGPRRLVGTFPRNVRHQIAKAKRNAEIAKDNAQGELGLENPDNPGNPVEKEIPDIGFRVLKLDSSSLLDVGVTTGEAAQETLALSRIREDRSPEDLLFLMLLETRIPLSDPIRTAEAKALNKWLYKNDYIDESDNVLPAWREARDAGTVPDLPASLEALKPFAEEVKRLVDSVRDPSAIRRFTQTRGPKPLPTNKNFAKSEFQELWSRINHKAAYTVDFSSDELVQKAVKARDREVDIPKLTYTVRKAVQTDGQTLQKHIYDWLVSDSEGERSFARDLDTSAEVVVYAKLPGGFSIPTPMGGYNPALGEKDTKYHVTYRKVASYADLMTSASSDAE